MYFRFISKRKEHIVLGKDVNICNFASSILFSFHLTTEVCVYMLCVGEYVPSCLMDVITLILQVQVNM